MDYQCSTPGNHTNLSTVDYLTDASGYILMHSNYKCVPFLELVVGRAFCWGST